MKIAILSMLRDNGRIKFCRVFSTDKEFLAVKEELDSIIDCYRKPALYESKISIIDDLSSVTLKDLEGLRLTDLAKIIKSINQ